MKTILAFHFIIAFAISASALSPKAALRVKVVDEEDQPVSGLSVTGWHEDRDFLGDYIYSVVTNKTGSDGTVRFEGRVYNGWIDYGDIKKSGFYRIDGNRVNFTNITGIISKEWDPYDSTQIVTLQKIGNPIPLFVRCAEPGRNKDLTTTQDKCFAYDLVKGDWMSPFGKGEHADIEFQLLPRENFGMGMGHSGKPKPSFRDTVNAKFVGEGNGICTITPPPNAVLKVRTAPRDGYERNFKFWFGQTKTMEDDTSTDKSRCQTFRIRTVKNEQGEIISALYGKVYGGFEVAYRYYLIPIGVRFTYYLNLTPNDRNLEWDMNHNLCPVNDSFNQP